MKKEIEITAHSVSIRKCISELESALADRRLPRSSGKLRAEYHEKLREVFEDIAERWYKKGFKRAHKVLFDLGKTKKKNLQKTMTMKSKFFRSGELEVDLDSQIKEMSV